MSWLCLGPVSRCHSYGPTDHVLPPAPRNSLGEASRRNEEQGQAPVELGLWFSAEELDVGCVSVVLITSFCLRAPVMCSAPLLIRQNRAFSVGEVEGLPVCLSSWLQSVDICALSCCWLPSPQPSEPPAVSAPLCGSHSSSF